MTRQKLTLNIVKQALLDSNNNLQIACKIANANYAAFYWWVKKYNLPFASKNKILATKNELENAYKILGSLSLVAKKFNTTPEGIRNKMLKFGLNINPLTINTVDDDFFSRDTEEVFYWAGFIAADGCVTNRKNKEDICVLYIGLAQKDRSHIEKFKLAVKFSGNIFDRQRNGGGFWPSGRIKTSTYCSEISITSRKMIADLKRFNIGPRKSLIYYPPEELINHPLFHHFLRGYFDGDGTINSSINKKTKSENFCFAIYGSEKFLNIYREVFENNKLVKINKKLNVDKRNNVMRLCYHGNIVTKLIGNFLYKNATVYLQRKFDKFQLIEALQNHTI